MPLFNRMQGNLNITYRVLSVICFVIWKLRYIEVDHYANHVVYNYIIVERFYMGSFAKILE